MVVSTSQFCLKYNDLFTDLKAEFQTMCRSPQWNCSDFSIPPQPYTNATDPIPMCSWTTQSSCAIVSDIYENMVRLDTYANTWWTNFFTASGRPLPTLIAWTPSPMDLQQCTEENAQLYVVHAENYLDQKLEEKSRLVRQLQASQKPKSNPIPLIIVFVIAVASVLGVEAIVAAYSRLHSRNSTLAELEFTPIPSVPPSPTNVVGQNEGDPVSPYEGGWGHGPAAY